MSGRVTRFVRAPALAAVLAVGLSLGVSMGPGAAWAETPSACTERFPADVPRPETTEAFPERGTSGHVAMLEVTVRHAVGDTVMPEGVKSSKALAADGFVVPEQASAPGAGSAPAGAAAYQSRTEVDGSGARTTLRIPLVLLPPRSGRSELTLPPLPISLSRQSGAVLTLCTKAHTITVDDPTANETNPAPKPNPEGRRQREEWTALKNALAGAAVALALAAFAAWLARRWLSAPAPEEHAPEHPPWIGALDELEAVAREPFVAERSDERFDRITDVVRKYVGQRYGFNGLEATSDEIRARVRRVRPQVPQQRKLAQLLEDSDLVKFARVRPVESDCVELVARCEALIRATIPAEEQAKVETERQEARAERAAAERKRDKARKKKARPIEPPPNGPSSPSSTMGARS